jgi:hypothetical protein
MIESDRRSESVSKPAVLGSNADTFEVMTPVTSEGSRRRELAVAWLIGLMAFVAVAALEVAIFTEVSRQIDKAELPIGLWEIYFVFLWGYAIHPIIGFMLQIGVAAGAGAIVFRWVRRDD